MALYYQDDWVKLYLDDARNMLDFIPPNSVHIIITSPPYNVGKDYDKHVDTMSRDEYNSLMRDVFEKCYKVLVPGGRICVNCPSCIMQTTGSKYAFMAVDIHNILAEVGFLPREWIFWVKKYIFFERRTSWGSWMSSRCPAVRDLGEFIIVMHKEKTELDGDEKMIDITKEEFLKFTYNCWEFQPETDHSKHPTPFPEELPYRLLKLYSYKGNIVLDPFVGSGTTCLVAKKLGRKSIGIDISEKYLDYARLRCSQNYLF